MSSPRLRRLVDKLGKETRIHGQQRFEYSRRRLFLVPAWTAALLLVFGAGFIFFTTIRDKFAWPPAAYNDPAVLNLTTSGQSWDVYYGHSEICGNLECHLTPDYPVERFQKQQVLPAREFPLRNYTTGQLIFYRTTVNLPPHLRSVNAGLILHTTYVWAHSFRLYVNGRLVDTGGAQLLNAQIPADLIGTDGKLFIAMRIDPGVMVYQGVANGGAVLLGSREKLQPLASYAQEQRVTLQLWFMIPKLTFGLLFAILFLMMPFNREYVAFATFAAMGAAKTYLVSQFGERLMAAGINNLLWVEIIIGVEYLALALFVNWFFRRHDTAFKWLFPIAAGLYTMTIIWVLAALPQNQGREIIAAATRLLRFGALVYGIYTAVSIARFLRLTVRSKIRQRVAMTMAVGFGIAFISLLVELTPVASLYIRSGALYLADISFFLMLAVLAAADFSSNFYQKEKLQSAFKQYLDPQLVDHLVWGGGTLSGEKKTVTILFCDIRSFSTISEVFPAEQVVQLLNEYFAEVSAVITAHGGHVDKFIGDACMAVWGARPGGRDDPSAALHAAVAMRRSVAQINERRRKVGQFEFRIGIGIHTGEVIAGEIGSSLRKDFTVIGDPVNATARIEALTKEMATDILVSQATVEIAADSCLVSPCGSVLLRGKQQEIEIFRLIGVIERHEGVHQLVINDPIFEEQFAHLSEAGIVADARPNLHVPLYNIRSVAS